MNNENITTCETLDVASKLKKILCIAEIEDQTELLKLKAAWSKKFRELSTNIGIVVKSKNNPAFRSKYVPLDAILEVMNDTIKAHDIAMCPSVGVMQIDNADYLYIEIMDIETGFSMLRAIFKLKTMDNKTHHQLGTELTYIKRYFLSSIFNISSDEDTDGNMDHAVAQTAIAAPSKQVGNKNYYDAKIIAEFISLQDISNELNVNWQKTYNELMLEVQKINDMAHKFVNEELAKRLIKAVALIKQEMEKKK